MTKYLATGAYEQWGVPFDTEEAAYRALYEGIKQTSANDKSIPESFDMATFNLSDFDPNEYFDVFRWEEADQLPDFNAAGKTKLLGFTCLIENSEGIDVAHGFFSSMPEAQAHGGQIVEVLNRFISW